MGKGTGFGKTILIGDSFVLNEVPAIVSAIPFETEAIVERMDGKGWTLADNRIEVPGYIAKKKAHHLASIQRILDFMEIDTTKTPIKITLGGSLLAGSGVGASAASCVSLARALDDEFNLGYTIEQINHVGWEGEHPYHGEPSGVDNTASTYGGLLQYYIKNGKKGFEAIKAEKPLDLVLANTGITADTTKLDGIVTGVEKKDPAKFAAAMKTITDQSLEMKKSIEEGDLANVGRIMTENHKILIDMGISHEKLIYLCDKAITNGALGAKLTGGGMGGYISALTPGKDLQEKVASAMEAEGYKVIRATIGG
jgi:mevalonate kinase